jgi:hypothetical protein
MPFQLTQQRLLTHHSKHLFVIDLPGLSSEFGAHAPISVAWELQNNAFNRIAKTNIVFGLRRGVWSRIEPGATDTKQGA